MLKEQNEQDTQLQQNKQSQPRLTESAEDLQLPSEITTEMSRLNSLGRHKSLVPSDSKERHFVQRSKSTIQQNEKHLHQNVQEFHRTPSQQIMEIQVNLLNNTAHQDRYKNQYDEGKSKISKSKLSRGISIIDDEHEFLQEIKFSSLERWGLLIVSAICNAFVPCWMTVDIQCEFITRSAWRIFTLSVLLLPFVFHEQKKKNRKPQDQLRNLLKREYLQKMYIGSINYCVWVLFGVLAAKITSRAHSFCFLRLKFFVVTLKKLYLKEECHEGEIGGSLLVGIGLFMMIWDSFMLPTQIVPDAYYLQCQWWQRFLGDMLAIVGCLVLIYLQGKHSLPKGPRFTNLFIYNVFISVNLVAFGYFFGGNEFTLDPKFGVFGLFTSQNFVGVFYVSIMLGLNLVIANVLVNQIFSEFIRNVASCFQIVITISVYHIFEIQKIYSGLTSLGLCFLVPGMMLIAGGQGTLQKLEIRINSQIQQTQIRSTLKRANALIWRPVTKIDHSQSLSPVEQQVSDFKSQNLKEKKE